MHRLRHLPDPAWLLLAAALAPLILAYILVRGQALLPARRDDDDRRLRRHGADRLQRDHRQAGAGEGLEFGTSLDYGYWVALLSAIAIAVVGSTGARWRAAQDPQGPRHRLAGLGASRACRHERDLERRALRAKPDRNLALELVRVTEAAALAASRWVGRGEKEDADGAAVDAMRLLLNTVPMDGIVVIGEGEKDEAPMLYNGE